MQRANWISTLAVLSHEGGYLLAYLYDNYYLQPNAYNELVEQVQRYDPSYTPESDSINWYNARELSDYLFELQHAYVALHGSSCTADFDLELYNESVAAFRLIEPIYSFQIHLIPTLTKVYFLTETRMIEHFGITQVTRPMGELCRFLIGLPEYIGGMKVAQAVMETMEVTAGPPR